MKKLLLITLLAGLCFMISACSVQNNDSKQTAVTQATSANTQETTAIVEKPTEMPFESSTESNLENWQQLYLDLINSNDQYSDFALIQVTNDSIPNLTYIDNDTNTRMFAMLSDDQTSGIQKIDVCECGNFPAEDTFLYQEHGLSFYYRAYVNKNVADKVYLINGEPTILFDGSYTDGFDYRVGGTSQQKGTYETMLKRSFDFDTAKKVTDYKEKNEIISEIETY